MHMHLKNFVVYKHICTYLYAARDVRNDIITIAKLVSGKTIEKKSIKISHNHYFQLVINLQIRPTTALSRSSCSSSNDVSS